MFKKKKGSTKQVMNQLPPSQMTQQEQQMQELQQAVQKKQKKGLFGKKAQAPTVDPNSQEKLRNLQNELRFYTTIRKEALQKNQLKNKKVKKALTSGRRYSLSEIEQLVNEITQVIQGPLTLNLLIEDLNNGHYYYFTDIYLQPTKAGVFKIIPFLQRELVQFTELDNPAQILIAMNRQYQSEVEIQRLKNQHVPPQPNMQVPPNQGNPMQQVGQGFQAPPQQYQGPPNRQQPPR